MLSFTQFLYEHYVTTDSPEEKMKYHDDVHSMIKQSYKDIGGHAGLGHGTDEESKAITNDIKNPNHIMKLKTVAGKPVAVAIYRRCGKLKAFS